MASNPVPVSSDSTTPGVSILAAATSTPGSAEDTLTSKSLKRNRPDTSSPASASVHSNPNKSPRFDSFSPGISPAPLTGAAALEDERRRREMLKRSHNSSSSATSENPGHKALSTLLSSGMSKPQDAPAEITTLSRGLSTAAKSITIPPQPLGGENLDTSPTSITSLASLGSAAQTATASTTAAATASPSPTYAGGHVTDAPSLHLRADPGFGRPSSKSLSFPGHVLGPGDPRAPARGSSLPNSGLNQHIAPRSPSHKKHKCPYCATEFTRHHNLKSHLLTHSQEKPYVCQTCQMRFRRLHDLKRHTKLHTGERPHICPKCDRKFARGDALARHLKGAGGCSGRRASMGSFGGDDDYEDSHAGNESMDGVMYGNDDGQQDVDNSEEERRFSLPSIKTQHVASAHGSQDGYVHSRSPSTYPPAASRQPPPSQKSGLHPPIVDGSGSSILPVSSASGHSFVGGHSTTTSISTAPSPGTTSMFSQINMTESPKPLSPGGMVSHQLGHDSSAINRQRSPSLTTQFQQQHFGRRPSERTSPQMSLTSPHGSQTGPKLPALSGLAPPEPRYTLGSQIPIHPQMSLNGSSSNQPGQQAPGGAGSGLPSGPLGGPMYQPPMGGGGPGRPPQPPGDNSANVFTADGGVWAYVEALEKNVKQLEAHILNIQRDHEERLNHMGQQMASMQSQLNAQNRGQSAHYAPMHQQ